MFVCGDSIKLHNGVYYDLFLTDIHVVVFQVLYYTASMYRRRITTLFFDQSYYEVLSVLSTRIFHSLIWLESFLLVSKPIVY